MKKHLRTIVLVLAPLVSISVMTISTACGGPYVPIQTINPFYSSFEDSDPIALSNSTYNTNSNLQNLVTNTTSGPQDSYTAKTGVGFTGLKSFGYSFTATAANVNTNFENYIYQDLNVIVSSKTELTYKIFPSFGSSSNPDLNYPATYACVDLLYNYSNSTNNLKSLSQNVNIHDEAGYRLNPYEQGLSKVLYSNQWNSKKIDLSPIRSSHIHAILINYYFGQPKASQNISGFIDDLSIQDKKEVQSSSLVEYVDTRRGTNSNGDFSRGNNIVATALPNGFNFYIPMTNAKDNWHYAYQKNNNSDNLPTLNGLGISHEPSPWIGDRDTFSVMPALNTSLANQIPTDGNNRKLAFSHQNEIAQPDYYSVQFQNNIKFEIAPSSHSVIFKINYGNNANFGSLIFDSRDDGANRHKFVMDNNSNTFWGWTDEGGSYSRAGDSRMFLYGEFNNDVNTSFQDNNRMCTTFDLSQNKSVELRVASSYISREQAERNLHLEILNDNLTFNDLRQKATNAWQKRLGAIDLHESNATYEQKVSMYSNLYRLNLYPNEQFENTGTISTPDYRYACPVVSKSGDATDDTTNAIIKNGKMYVNNGFWDTYRTVWPTYCLLYPKFAKELIDGFLLQYQDGGWVARWSAPGYADCMTGTSSDSAFADAYTSGAVTDLDTALMAFNNGYKDATTNPTSSDVGRKSLSEYKNNGYISTSTDESVSWSMENYACDYATAQLAYKLSNDPNLTDARCLYITGKSKSQLVECGNQLMGYANKFPLLYNPNSNAQGNVFQGRTSPPNGTFSNRNATTWGNEYTETDGWNYAFPAFASALDDGEIFFGNTCYGSKQNVANNLDTFFATPELANNAGSYGGVIHEMREARDVRLGQLGFSNQPSHHIPFMYTTVNQSWKTQKITREILQRLYTGNDIGQGYCGDEDNGEMSAWYILSSLGIYNLALGSGKYVVTSPLFNKAIINRDNGLNIKILAPKNNNDNIYIKSFKLNNHTINGWFIDQQELLSNNNTLTFEMTSEELA